ncbi:cupin-like domain-containing protein [Streptomyces sp. NPDC051976]|uniref:cupin-like domain-containing protein n=1 Tax=Streptomyces sp. NPDC051976 TaxID=3154947 RepID=UPI003443D00C
MTEQDEGVPVRAPGGAGIVVVGMHRSGTSATTRVLNLLGLPTCRPADLIGSRAGNAKGHWESTSLMVYNEALLGRLGCAWWCPPSDAEISERLDALDDEVAKAAAVFNRTHLTPQWVWKDPRLCLLLPWWRRVLPVPTAAVLVVRHPLEVAASLRKRNRITPDWALGLWERYTRQALVGLQGTPVFVLPFSRLLADPLASVDALRDFVVRHGLEVTPGAQLSIDAFLDTTLRHHNVDADHGSADLDSRRRDLARFVDELAGDHEVFTPGELPAETPATDVVLGAHRRRWSTLNHNKESATPGPARSGGLTVDWRRWLTKNRLLQIPDEHLVRILCERAGLDKDEALAELADLLADPRHQAAEELVQQQRKAESFLDIRQQMAELMPSAGEPERRCGVGRGEFLARYYSANTPVVLTDLTAGWTAGSRWNLDHFRETLGDEIVEVMSGRDGDAAYERNSDHHRVSTRFADYLDHVESAERSNAVYLTANNHLLENPAAKSLWEDFDSPPAYLDPDDATHKVFLWLGPSGTITPLHHDVQNVLLVQVRGTKRVLLVDPLRTHTVYNDLSVYSAVDADDPDYTKHPRYRHARPVEVLLRPGEALFIPVGWWHYVESLETSISLSFTNFRWPNSFVWSHPG